MCNLSPMDSVRRMRVVPLAVLVLALLLLARPATADPGPPVSAVEAELADHYRVPDRAGVETSVAASSDTEQAFVELLNQRRIEKGLFPLKLVDELSDAARVHAEDMAADRYFDHDSWDRDEDGHLEWVQEWETRVLAHYQGAAIGEAIAVDYADPQDVLDALLALKTSRDVLLGPYREVGVGHAEAAVGPYDDYWTVDAGRQASIYPIIINGEAATTDSPLVEIHVHGTWEEVRFRNNGGGWGPWGTVRSQPIQWRLPDAAGAHTVCAQMHRTSDGASAEACDVIVLQDQGPVCELGGMPDTVEFTHYILHDRTLPTSASVLPADVRGGGTISWEASSKADWLEITPRTGQTGEPGQTFEVRLNEAAFHDVGIHSTVVEIRAVSPRDVAGSPHNLVVRANVVNAGPEKLFLPWLFR